MTSRRTGSKEDHEQAGIDLEGAIHDKLYAAEQHWHEASVSRGAFIATVVGVVIAFTVAMLEIMRPLFADRTDIEHRMTVVETIQQSVLRDMAAVTRSFAERRLELNATLAQIQQQLSSIAVELSKHEAATKAK